MKIFHRCKGRLNIGLFIWEDYPINSFFFHPFEYVYGIDVTHKKLFQFFVLWNFEKYE